MDGDRHSVKEPVNGYLDIFGEGKLYSSAKCVGRNNFVSEKGFCGVGPPGDNRLDNNPPVIQAGDFIVLLSEAPTFVILRRIDDQYFSLVGPAHVPSLHEDPDFKKGISEEFRKFRIR